MTLSEADKKGVRIMTAVGMIFLIIAAMAGHAKWDELQYDEVTLCRVDSDYSVAFLIVDKTDRWTKDQIPTIKNKLEKVKNSLAKYERLYIYTINSDGIQTRPLFDMCNPGQGKQFNPLNNNPRLRQKRWKESFGIPFEKIIDKASQPGQTNRTNLLEMLDYIELYTSKENLNRVFFISDMMQNSDRVSFYGRIPSHGEVKDKLPEIGFLYEATVYFHNRLKNGQKIKAVKQFWTQYFEESGVESERISWEEI